MPQDDFNMSMRKFLKKVGVSSQKALESAAGSASQSGQKTLKVKMVLTAEGTDLTHEVRGEIDLD